MVPHLAQGCIPASRRDCGCSRKREASQAALLRPIALRGMWRLRTRLSRPGPACSLRDERRRKPLAQQSDFAESPKRKIELQFRVKSTRDGVTMDNNKDALNRREALIKLLRVTGAGVGAAGLGAWLSQRSFRPEAALATAAKHGHAVPADPALPEMAIIQGDDPAQLARQAVEELGGMRRFISRGDLVLVKPNIGWDRTPEQAASTNPEVVAEIVRQCLNAGAKRVTVADVSCNEARRCFQRSGIADAAQRAGAEVVLPDPSRFKDVDLKGEVLRDWQVFDAFLN